MKILETARLRLREMTDADYPALCRMLRDADVMHAYAHAFSAEEARAWLVNQQRRYREDGFGLWALERKDTDGMVGQCGLTWQEWDGKRVLEIGYLLQKDAWGNGYATEAAIGAKRYAWDTLGAQAVYSIIRDRNIASQRVAQRNGMTVRGAFTKHYYGQDMPHLVYGITRDEDAVRA